jgi:hypothetical protein
VSPRAAGGWLVAAALLFWLAWALMPAVGTTDTRQIFDHVAARAPSVRASVILQLVSATCYAPALVGIARSPEAEGRRSVALGATFLLIGAMGSAADAVLHLLAVEMVAPGIDRAAMVPVMERMQGPNLALLGPLLAAFFAGSIALAVGGVRAGVVPRWNPWLFALALPALALGGGLALLACVSASQAGIGVALLRGRSSA